MYLTLFNTCNFRLLFILCIFASQNSNNMISNRLKKRLKADAERAGLEVIEIVEYKINGKER